MTTQTSPKKPDAHSIYDNNARASLIHGKNCDEKIALWQYVEILVKCCENCLFFEESPRQTTD
jgi:hypothetical protein